MKPSARVFALTDTAVLEIAKRILELTPFRGHLIVLAEGVRRVQTAHPQAALSGAIS